MGSYERRLAALETKVKNLEARAEISKESRPSIGSDHQGKKSAKVIIQEFFSLKNSFKPEAMSNKNKAEFIVALDILRNDLKSDAFPPDNPERIKMNMEIEKMLGQLR